MTQDSTQANKGGSPATVAQPWGDHERPTPLLSKPWILDAYCGAGGASMGYHRAGFEVIGVDIRRQPNYPFHFVQADAIEFLSELISIGPAAMQYVAIHASPPCQFASKAKVIWDNIHPDLLFPTRELLKTSGLPYVIENVKGAPLRDPVVLEGQMFGLNTHRPRLFETNWPLSVPTLRLAPGPMAKMGRPIRPGESVQVIGHFSDVNAGREAMGIDWMSRDELSEAIPPAYTEFIGQQLLEHLDDTPDCYEGNIGANIARDGGQEISSQEEMVE